MQATVLLDTLQRLTLLTSAALLLLAVMRPMLRRTLGARATYAAWLLVPLLLASPWLPVVPLELPLNLTAQPAERQATPNSNAALMATQQAGIQPTVAPAAALSTRALAHRSTALLALWLAGAATLAAVTWRSQRRYESTLERTADGHWQAPAGHSPAVVGLFMSRLVLPRDFKERFDAASQRLMLAHEAVHQRRYDNAWNLLAAVLLCLQWFNPLAWWGARRLRDDQELACDEAVLDSVDDPAAPTAYALAMVAAHVGPQRAWLASAWTGGHPLVQRMRLLASYRRASKARRWGALTMVVAVGTGAALVARAAQQPPTPSADPTATRQGLALTIASQMGGQGWHHAKMFLPLDRPLVGGAFGPTMQTKLPGWCLSVQLHIFEGGTVRPVAQPLDETCQTPLADWQELRQNGRMSEFATQTAQGPLRAQVAVRWTLPSDTTLPALNRAEAADQEQLSAAQLAEIARQREQISQARRDLDAQDRAWRTAREPQSGIR